jgi:hypothetical protein
VTADVTVLFALKLQNELWKLVVLQSQDISRTHGISVLVKKNDGLSH